MAIESNVFFLDRSTKSAPQFQKAILILSPSFYWFVKEKLDISLSQAKKIAPSIFEGIIPEGNYSYFVQKVGDEFWFFAYNDEEILAKLKELGIKPSQIRQVYAAQMVLGGIKEPIAVGDRVYMVQDGVVVALPSSTLQIKAKPFDKSELTFTKHSLPLKSYSSLAIDESKIFSLSLLLFGLIVAFGVEGWFYKENLQKLIAKEKRLSEKYSLPQTSLQIKSILSSLYKIQNEQLRIRDELEAILRIPLRRGEHFEKIQFAKKILFSIALSDPKRAETIKEYLVKRLNVTSMVVRGNILEVECKR